MLRPLGSLLILYMAWLPFEDPIAAQSERLILKYSPQWSGAGESLRPIPIPDCYDRDFACIYHEEYPLKVHFSRESWHGRVKASRGISASLSEEALRSWEREHRALLAAVPEEFDILHYAAAAELKRRKQAEAALSPAPNSGGLPLRAARVPPAPSGKVPAF